MRRDCGNDFDIVAALGQDAVERMAQSGHGRYIGQDDRYSPSGRRTRLGDRVGANERRGRIQWRRIGGQVFEHAALPGEPHQT